MVAGMLAELRHSAWMGAAATSASSDGLLDMLTTAVAAALLITACAYHFGLLCLNALSELYLFDQRPRSLRRLSRTSCKLSAVRFKRAFCSLRLRLPCLFNLGRLTQMRVERARQIRFRVTLRHHLTRTYLKIA